MTKCGCGHLFHTKCLMTWLETRRVDKPCPICRQEVITEQRCSAPISPLIIKNLGTKVLSVMEPNSLAKMEREYQAKSAELATAGAKITKQLFDNVVACHKNDQVLKAIQVELRERSQKAKQAKEGEKEEEFRERPVKKAKQVKEANLEMNEGTGKSKLSNIPSLLLKSLHYASDPQQSIEISDDEN